MSQGNAGVEDAESSQSGKPAQPEPGKDLTAEEEALLTRRRRRRQQHLRTVTMTR